MSDVTFGIKLKFDGKDVDAGITVSREQFRQFAIDAKRAGDAAAGGFTSAAKGVRSVSEQLSNVGSMLSSGLAATASIATLREVTNALQEAALGASKLANTYSFAFGSIEAGARNLAYVKATANALGTDLLSSAQAYGKLSAAAIGTNLEGEKTRAIFESVSKAATVMGLSAEESNGALLAISQMMSKGTVQAEELRGQLGERLPGAFNIASRAMGVSTAQLGKMLEQGTVLASDFLPKFAIELERTLGDSSARAADSLQANLNRMSNAWLAWKQALAGDGNGDWMKGFSSGLADAAGQMEKMNKQGSGFFSRLFVGIGATEMAILNSVFGANVNTGAGLVRDGAWMSAKLAEIARLTKESKDLENAGAGTLAQGSVNRRLIAAKEEFADAQKTRNKQAIALPGKDELAAEAKKTKDRIAADLEAQGDQLKAELTKNSPIFSALQELENYKKKFSWATTDGTDKQNSDYQSGLAAIEKKVADARKNQSAGQRTLALENLDNQLKLAEQKYKLHIEQISALEKQGLLGEGQTIDKRLAEEQTLLEARIALTKQKASAASSDPAEARKFANEAGRLQDELTALEARGAGERAVLAKKEGEEILALRIDTAKRQGDQVGATYLTLQKEYGTKADAWARDLVAAAERGDVAAVARLDSLLNEYQKKAEAALDSARFGEAKNGFDAMFAGLQMQLDEIDRQAGDGWMSRWLGADKAQAAIAAARPKIEQELAQLSTSASSDAEKKAATDASREWKKTADAVPKVWKDTVATIDSDFHSGFTRMLEAGKGDWASFSASLRNSFKTQVADAAYQLFARPFMLQVVASGAGALGMNGLAAAATQASGSGAGNLLSTGSNLYNLSMGSSGLSSMAGGAISAAGNLTGISALSEFGAGMQGASLAAGLAGPTTAGASGAMGLGASFSAAMPYIGAAVVVASLLSSKGGGPKNGGGSGASIVDGRYVDMGRGAVSYTPSGDDASMTKTTSALASDYMRYATQLGGIAANTKMSLAYDADPNGTAPNRISGMVTGKDGKNLFADWNHDVGRDSANLQTQLSLETKKMLLAALQGSDLPAAVAAVLSTVDAATATSEQIDKVLALADTFKTLSQILPQFAGMGADSVKELANSVGDNFAAQFSDYYQSYYSQTERDLAGLKTAQGQVDTVFKGLGKAVPQSMDELKAFVGALDLTTEAGRNAFNETMKIEGTFATIQRATTSLLNNAIAAWSNYQSAIGNSGAVQAAGSTLAGINNDKSQDKLAASFGIDRKTLDAGIAQSGLNLAEIAAKYWSQMNDAQKAAMTDALSNSAALISAVKVQWDAQQQIVQTAYNNVAKFKDFGAGLDTQIANIRIDAGSLDKGAYLDGEISKQKDALNTLYSSGASPDELLATASKLRDLTIDRYNTEINSTKEISKFMVGVGDYLKGLKVGDLSPLTMGQKLTEAGAQLNDVLLTLESGTEAQKAEARSKLTSNADAYLKLAQQYDPSTYASVFNEVQKALGQYADTGTVAEQQLAQQQAIAVKATDAVIQLQALKAQAGGWQSVAQGKLDSALASLAPLSAKLDQLGAGGAIATAIRDLPTALATAITAGQRGGATAAVSTTPTPATKTYPTGSAATGGLGGTALLGSIDGSEASIVTMLTRSRAAGMMPADIAALWNDAHPDNKVSTEDLTAWAKQRGIPGFDVGTNSVTEDTLAVIHKRERIMPAADNTRLFEILEGGSNAGSDPAMLRMLGALLQKMDTLIANQERLAALVAESHARSNEAAAGQVVEAINSSAKQRTSRTQELSL